MTTSEQVVLVDDAGHGIGLADKALVHGADTPLHLAFSCYIFDAGHRLLLTRRAWHKRTWPGVWTNSCCGHPAPGEPIAEAVRRRTREELGLRLDTVTLVLPEFRYRAQMPDGTTEHELCPVFVATTSEEARPDPAEVAAHRWVAWAEVRSAVLGGSLEVSPWCHLQVGALPETPYDAPAGDPHRLPFVVRP